MATNGVSGHLEGSSNFRPPLFLGTENYNLWKNRMLIHLSREPLKLRVMQIRDYVFNDKDRKLRDVDDLTDVELVKLGYNGKARNTVMNGLCPAECDKVSSCSSIKEIFDTLLMCHKGSKSLKKVKLSKLIKEFGNFKLSENEYIRDAQSRFQTNIKTIMAMETL